MSGRIIRLVAFTLAAAAVVLCVSLVYRTMIVDSLVKEIESFGSAVNDDYLLGFGPTGVTIGLHVAGEAPQISPGDACALISKLPAFWRLRFVTMNDVPVSAECIETLLSNTRLLELRANGTSFDDDCIEAAVAQGSLALLSIRDTHISRNGVLQLRGLKSLKVIYVGENGFTAEDYRTLKQELPEVDIVD